MSEENLSYEANRRKRKFPILHIFLFLATFLTCTVAGAQWAYVDFTEIMNWHHGLTYATLVLTFLSAHEFGHYFASRYHRVDATLPYYIPFPIPITINFGTFGAVIKTRSPIPSRKALFDIGASGPLAGMVVSIVFIIIGLATLPGKEFIYNIHPEYLLLYGDKLPNVGLHFGDTLLFDALAYLFANPKGFMPPMNEIYHYPFLNVGWFGLFVTSLNLLPFGQLDGGHIIYSMFGDKQKKISRISWWLLTAIGLSSLLGLFHLFLKEPNSGAFVQILQNVFLPSLNFLHFKVSFLFEAWSGWLVWALITRFFVKLDHPPVYDESDIGIVRKSLGWLCMIILVLTFSYNGIYFIE